MCQVCRKRRLCIPVHRYGGPDPTIQCKECDRQYLKEKREFYRTMREMGQEI